MFQFQITAVGTAAAPEVTWYLIDFPVYKTQPYQWILLPTGKYSNMSLTPSKLYIYCKRIPWIARVIYTVEENTTQYATETTVVC